MNREIRRRPPIGFRSSSSKLEVKPFTRCGDRALGWASVPECSLKRPYDSTMRADLRGFYSSDVDDLEAWRPDDPGCFEPAVRAFVGPEGGGGEEMFDFRVCTAAWLEKNPPPKGFEFLRSTLLLTRWDYLTLERALSDLCLHTSGDNWSEVVTRLSRFGGWEFEDYRG